jgi:hypothetical protein
MASSAIGRGCVALIVGVVYAGRALPVAWLVIAGKKGHFSQQRHLELLNQVAVLVSPEVTVTFLGDGEFDGTLLQERLAELNWQYLVRTAKNRQLYRKALEGEYSSQVLSGISRDISRMLRTGL